MNNIDEKQDLTSHSDNELSLIVFNDEYLYRQRSNPHLEDILNEHFIFTIDQYQTLCQDIQDELNESDVI
jgi:hypothetical protein